MESIGFGYIPKLTLKYQEKARAPLIPQTGKFYHHLISAGYKVPISFLILSNVGFFLI